MFRMDVEETTSTGSLNEQWGCSFLIVCQVTKGKHSSHRCLDTHQQQGAAALPSPRTFLQVNLPKTLWERRRLKPLSITRINVCYLLTLWNVDGPGHETFDLFLAAFCFMYQMIYLPFYFLNGLPWYGMNTKCNQYVWVEHGFHVKCSFKDTLQSSQKLSFKVTDFFLMHVHKHITEGSLFLISGQINSIEMQLMQVCKPKNG